MKKILLWVGILSFIGSTATADYYYMKKLEELSHVKTMKVQTKTLNETLIASGKVVPAGIERVSLDPSKGAVKEIFVEEGDEVTAGTRLLKYADGEIVRQTALLELKKQRVEAQINYLNDRIDELDNQIDVAENDDLSEQVTRQLENEKSEAAYQLELADYDLQEFELQLQQLRDQEEALVVESDTAGVVVNVNEDIASNAAVITIASSVFEIEGTLSEYDTAAVEKGQEVTVTAKALPEKSWSGEISDVSSLPVSSESIAGGRGDQVTAYPFSVTFAETPDQLKQGYHVNLEIVVAKHEGAVVLPFDSIINENGKEYVYVFKSGKIEQREISTGLVKGKWNEITSGLKKGETVVLDPSEDLYDGMEVTPDDPTGKRDKKV